MREKFLTIFSSDWTRQYELDIFSILSLPRNCMFSISYQDKYLDSSVKTMFEKKNYKFGNRALIIFRSNAEKLDNTKFCIPIRWVQIKSFERMVNDGWTIHFVTQGYPEFSPEYAAKTNCLSGIEKLAEETFAIFSHEELSVLNSLLNCVNSDKHSSGLTSDSKNWTEIIKRIAMVPQYANYHFLKCSKLFAPRVNPITHTTRKKWCKLKNNHFAVTEQTPLYVDIEYYATDYKSDFQKTIDIWVNEKALTRTNGYQISLLSRYGTKRFGFQPQKVPDNTFTEIEIALKRSSDNKLLTEIVFPVVVNKNKKYRAFKALIMGVGALLVALPGMMSDEGVLIFEKILYAGAGGIILALGGYMESKE